MAPVKKKFRQRQRHFLREWRIYRGSPSLEVIGAKIEVHPSTLSRIERGDSPYDQDILEKLALVYGCEPPDLLNIDPTVKNEPGLLLSQLKAAPTDVRERARLVIEALLKAG